MIELLYTLLTVLGISFIPFILLSSFQYTKIYFYSFHIIVWIILVSINDYKQHYLWNEAEFELIHNTPYPPIKDINPIYDKKIIICKIFYLIILILNLVL